MKNNEFEEQIKLALLDIDLIPELKREVDMAEGDHRDKQMKMIDMQEENSKEPLF
jgi:hypothetical protein